MIWVLSEELARKGLDITCILPLLVQLADTVIIESELKFVLVMSEWFLSQAERFVSNVALKVIVPSDVLAGGYP